MLTRFFSSLTGDCYVAVAGLPEARKDHAVVMARFARDCLYKLKNLLPQLEQRLGPDTSDLSIRVGLHSGPVTAGVLRGERARFQLFGDTGKNESLTFLPNMHTENHSWRNSRIVSRSILVNTASRIETTGARDRIHVSQETANILTEAGKGHWLREREDKVVAKGKGQLSTFWLEMKAGSAKSTMSSGSTSDDASEARMAPPVLAQSNDDEAKMARLVSWTTDVLARSLRAIVARRKSTSERSDPEAVLDMLEGRLAGKNSGKQAGTVIDEVQEVITLPQFDAKAAKRAMDPESIELAKNVMDQLHDYVRTIAAMYHNNPFHSFDHVSHVNMSVAKLLSRIVAPDLGDEDNEDVSVNEKTLHDHTYGITSDPLTQFAVLFSATVHDVDHQGVPNAQLVKEKASVAMVYQNKSVAEQNSVDIAWDLLMDEKFRDLRRTIYATSAEFYHFRCLVVNSVLATDIMDKDLGAARKERWNKAFSETPLDNSDHADPTKSVNRKATIVIEHLIQASDVAHTMQHWHIFRVRIFNRINLSRDCSLVAHGLIHPCSHICLSCSLQKWNSRLFEEMSHAYYSGRSDKNPADNWYEGEIGFFDFYVIPLAKKLKDCGVFGVSSDEYLNFALKNRSEWEVKGQEIVSEMVEAWNQKNKV